MKLAKSVTILLKFGVLLMIFGDLNSSANAASQCSSNLTRIEESLRKLDTSVDIESLLADLQGRASDLCTLHDDSSKPAFDTIWYAALGVGIAAAVTQSIFRIPQIWKIFRTKEAKSISQISNFVGLSAASLWLTYGVLKTDVVMMSTSTLSVLQQLLLILGTHCYGPKKIPEAANA